MKDKQSQKNLENEEISFQDIQEEANTITESEELDPQELLQTQRAELEAKSIVIQLYGQKQFLDLQKTWARHIKWQIWAVLSFQFLFVMFIGFNVMGFTDNIEKLPYMYIVIVLQSLANIIALGFVVAKFLFPKVPNNKQ